MTLSPAMIVGQYRVGRKLGSGGMGEVYHATHLLLGRQVALKTLRLDALAGRASLLIKEARATCALDHPHIVKVYDAALVDASAYIAMEYVDGRTLVKVLSQRALRSLEAVQYALQIAQALAAAHDMGILHRDVKPGNIMVTRRNEIKVVDFGLAKRFDDAGSSRSEATTRSLDSEPSPVRKGGFAGTVGYTSPEQIRGLPMDARSDIFSFGVVLYEMLTRERPFAAQSDAVVIERTLQEEPRPVQEIRPEVPDELCELVRFCLAKNPNHRARSMHDVAYILERLQQSLESNRSKSPRLLRRWRRLLAAAVATALISGVAAVWFLAFHREQAPARATLRRITWDDGLSELPALSNDGSLLAFASDRADSKNLDIFVRQTNGNGEPVRLTSNPADDSEPSFSPDGSQIVFRSERQGGGVYVVPTFGGQERLVAPRGHNPHFSPDGNWIVYWIGETTNMYPSARTYIVPTAGSAARQLQARFADARYPIWTPDGQHILFQGVDVWNAEANPDRDWWVAPVNDNNGALKAIKTGAWDAIRASGFPTIYPPGGWHGDKVVFSARNDSARLILSVPISTRTWHVSAPAETLTFGTGIDGYPYPTPAGAIAFTSYKYEINIWSKELDENGLARGEDARKLTSGEAYHTGASMDAGGRRLAFLLGRHPSTNVWIRDLGADKEIAVTTGTVDKCSAAISADGSRVAWSVCGPGPEAVFISTINTDFSIPVAEKVCDDCGRVLDWSRSGDSLMFLDHSRPVGIGLLKLPSGTRTLISSSRFHLNSGRFSPRGDWIALSATKLGGDRTQIFVVPLKEGEPATESAWIAVTNGDWWDENPVWTEQADALLFYSRRDGFGCIWRQGLNPTTKRPRGAPNEVVKFHNGRLSIRELTGSLPSLFLIKDRILFNALERTGSIWILEDSLNGQKRY